MAEYNPFKKDKPKDPNGNWFYNTSIKAIAFGGTAFGVYGVYKMKGPAQRILDKIHTANYKKVFQTEYQKQSNVLESAASDIRVTDPFQYYGYNYKDVADNIMTPSSLIIKSRQYEHVLANNLRHDTTWLPLAGNIQSSLKDNEFFSRFRYELIDEYMSRYGAESLQQYENLQGYAGDIIKNGKNVEKIHEYFLRNYPDYARKYLNKLESLYNRASRLSVKEFSPIEIRDRLLKVREGPNDTDQLIDFTFSTTVHSNISSDGKLKKVIGELPSGNRLIPSASDDVLEMISTGKATKGLWTSKGPRTPKLDIYKKLQSFEYIAHFKGLTEQLIRLKNSSQYSGLEDIEVKLETYGSGEKSSRYLYIGMKHQNKNTYWFYIPISVDGRMPGSNFSSQEYMDGIKMIGGTWGGNNYQEVNTTQMMINKVTGILKGQSFWGEFKERPERVISALTNSILTLRQDLSPWSDTVRDASKIVSIHDPLLNAVLFPKAKRANYIKNQLSTAVISAKRLRQLKRSPNAKLITLDLETLSNSLNQNGRPAGVQAAIHDPNLQIAKAAVVVTDFNNNNTVLESHAITSDHGVDVFDGMESKRKGKGWNAATDEWAFKLFPHSANQEQARERLIEHLREETKLDNQTGIPKFKNNRDFVQYLAKIIRGLKQKYGESNVFFNVKNGIQFDLRIIDKYAPDLFNEMINSTIDVHSLAYARLLGQNAPDSLAIEEMTQVLLGRYIDPEKIPNLRENPIAKDVIEKLTADTKGKFLNDPNFRLLNTGSLRGKLARYLNQRAHMSPTVDALISSALLRAESTYANDDSFYEHLDDVEKLLELGSRSQNMTEVIELYKSTKTKTLDGFSVGFSGMSSGMVAQLKGSLLQLNDLIPLGENPFNKQLDHTWRGIAVGPSQKFRDYLKRSGHDPHGWKMKRKFTDPLVGSAVLDFETHMMRRADSMKNYFSHHVVSDVLYVFNSYMGHEGFNAFSETMMKDITVYQDDKIPIDFLENDVNLGEQVRDFKKKVYAKAVELSKTKGKNGKLTREILEEAGADVAANSDFNLSFGQHIASKNGSVIRDSKIMGGKVYGVMIEPNFVSSSVEEMPKMFLKVAREMTGSEFERVPLMANVGEGMSKAVVSHAKYLSQAFAYNKVSAIANADFVKKGTVGSLKRALIRTVIRKHLDIIHDTNSTPDQIAKSKLEMKGVAAKLGGEYVENEHQIVMPHNRRFPGGAYKDLIKNESNMEEVMKYFGDVDVRFKDIMEMMIGADFQKYTKETINASTLSGSLGSFTNQLANKIRETAKGLSETFQSKDDIKHMLTEKGVSRLKVELNAFAEFVTAKEGNIQLFQASKFGRDEINNRDIVMPTLIPVADVIALSNIDIGYNTQTKSAKIRRSYLDAVFHSENKFPHTAKQYLMNNIMWKKHIAAKSLAQNYNLFRDAMTNSTILDIKDVQLEDLQKLLDFQGKYEFRKEIKRGLYDADFVGAIERLEEILELKVDSENEIYKKEVSDQIDAIQEYTINKQRVFAESTKTQSRFWSQTKVQHVSEFARKNNGIISLDTTIGGRIDALELSVREMAKRHMDFSLDNSKNKVSLGQYEDQIVSKIKNVINASKGEPLYEVVERDGEKFIKMKKVIINLDKTPENLFNRLSNDVSMALPETKIKFDLMASFLEYQKLILDRDQKMDNVPHTEDSYIVSKTKELQNQMARFWNTGMEMNNKSDSWGAHQIELPSLWATHKGTGEIVTAAWMIKNSKGSILSKSLRKGIDFSMIDKLLTSSMDTLFITENVFDQMVTLKDGASYSLARHLDESFGEDYTRQIRSGEKTLPGGIFFRYPVSPAGRDGMLTNRYQVIPKGTSKLIGMDDNSFYAHTIYSGLQGFDNDSDKGFLGIINLDVAGGLDKINKEWNDKFNNLIKRPDMKKKITFDLSGAKGRTSMPVGFSGDQVILESWDENGNQKLVSMDINDKDFKFDKIYDNALDLFHRMSTEVPGMLTNKEVQKRAVDYTTGISKKVIPLATNAMRANISKMLIAQKNGRIPVEAMANFLGDLDHSISQATIDMAKHDEKIAQNVKVIEFFRNPEKATSESRQAYHDYLINEVWADQINEKPEIKKYINMQIDVMQGKVGSVEEATRYAVGLRNNGALRAVDNVLTGRATASMWDQMQVDFVRNRQWDPSDLQSSWENSSPNSFTEDTMNSIYSSLKNRFKLSKFNPAVFKKSGKYGSLVAGVFLAANFFRPHQLSSSLNPLDMFNDLGTDIDGTTNRIHSDLELERDVPLDTINASFSKQAYVKLSQNDPSFKNEKSNIIYEMLNKSLMQSKDYYREYGDMGSQKYSNYTNSIGYFGNSNITRKYK